MNSKDICLQTSVLLLNVENVKRSLIGILITIDVVTDIFAINVAHETENTHTRTWIEPWFLPFSGC